MIEPHLALIRAMRAFTEGRAAIEVDHRRIVRIYSEDCLINVDGEAIQVIGAEQTVQQP